MSELPDADDLVDDSLEAVARDLREHLRFELETDGFGAPFESVSSGAMASMASEGRPAARTPAGDSPRGVPRAGSSAASPTPRAPAEESRAPAPMTPPSFSKAKPKAPEVAPPEPTDADLDAVLARAKRALGATAKAKVVEPPAPTARVASATDRDGERLVKLRVLADAAAGCTKCRLHEGRTKSVFSRGDAFAEIMFVGEGPGHHEDQSGEPFVGAAGQLLDKMIVAMGRARDGVYVCNVVKCRPPENRTPLPDEAAACLHFLESQIVEVKPRVIVALGRCAAENLGCASPGKTWRGVWGEFAGIPVMSTYHPAYLLRSPEQKRVVWEDLQKVMGRLAPTGGA